MTSDKKNLPASVHSRLLNLARKKRRTFGELLQFYGLERFLYRLSVSEYKNQYILKGAMMFLHWTGEQSRPTRDIDLLRYEPISVAELTKVFKIICNVDVKPDGVNFDSKTVKAERIIPEQGQSGVRVTFKGYLGKSEIPMQIDVALGYKVVPKVKKISLATLLDFPRPVLKGYSPETSLAEKIHAITKLGLLNSRLKDYYDLWYIMQNVSINQRDLVAAIRKTFQNRNTPIPPILPEGFSDAYAKRHKDAWLVMLRRNSLEGPDLQQVINFLAKSIEPVLLKAAE